MPKRPSATPFTLASKLLPSTSKWSTWCQSREAGRSITRLTLLWHFKAQGKYLIIRILHFSDTPEQCPKFRDHLSSAFRQTSLFLRYCHASHFKCQETRIMIPALQMSKREHKVMKTLRHCNEYTYTYLYTYTLLKGTLPEAELLSYWVYAFFICIKIIETLIMEVITI